ncbi:MAG: helix-turn-helix transcriptional regulator [Candidatus Limiplasma sp.]|nr:helix-turn-helix transcriptional regulator [Candidatus Limiplasma sp.]
MSIGDRLKDARKANGLTQEQLSELAGVARENIGRYETGKSQPTVDVLIRLADALNVSTDYLFERSGDLHIKKSMREILDTDPITAGINTLAANGAEKTAFTEAQKQELQQLVRDAILRYDKEQKAK